MNKEKTNKVFCILSNEVEKLYGDFSPNFYGKITFTFEKGKVTVIRKEETIKPNIK